MLASDFVLKVNVVTVSDYFFPTALEYIDNILITIFACVDDSKFPNLNYPNQYRLFIVKVNNSSNLLIALIQETISYAL
jgi:hypothetical protein